MPIKELREQLGKSGIQWKHYLQTRDSIYSRAPGGDDQGRKGACVGRRGGLYESAYQHKTDGVFNFRINWKRFIYTGIDFKGVGRCRAITKHIMALRLAAAQPLHP